MPENAQSAGEVEVQRAILDVATEDWYGLWEIYDHAALVLHRAAGKTLREELRRQLRAMMARGLLEAAIWTEGPPRAVSPDEVRFLPIDSELWGSPMNLHSVEQLRITATEAGDRLYFENSKQV